MTSDKHDATEMTNTHIHKAIIETAIREMHRELNDLGALIEANLTPTLMPLIAGNVLSHMLPPLRAKLDRIQKYFLAELDDVTKEATYRALVNLGRNNALLSEEEYDEELRRCAPTGQAQRDLN